MKKLLLLLYFVSSFCFGQQRGIFTSGFTPTTDTTIHAPVFHNASYTHKIVHDPDDAGPLGVRGDGVIVMPYGYASPTWEVQMQNLARTVIASGTGQLVRPVFYFLTLDTANVYALRVKGGPSSVLTTSATSKALSGLTLPQTYTVATGLTTIRTGMVLRLASAAVPTDYVEAIVTSYTSGTGALIMSASGTPVVSGTGTHTDWNVQLPDIDYIFPGEWTVYPHKVTAANAAHVINLAAFSSPSTAGTWTNTPGDTWYFYGALTSNYVNIFYQRSDDPTNPIIMAFDNASITNSTYLLRLGENKNLVIDGMTNEAVQYGLILTKTGGGGSQENIYINVDDNVHSGRGLMMGGVSSDNNSYLLGGTGLVIQVANNGTFNGTNTDSRYYTLFNMLLQNTGNETIYLGHCCSTSPQSIVLKNLFVYHITTNHSGNESCQMGTSYYAEVFGNTWNDSGLNNSGGQNYNNQFNINCRYISWYMNQGTGAYELYQAVATEYAYNTEMWANRFESTKASGASATFWHLGQNTVYPFVYYGVAYNTIVKKTDIVFQIYNDLTPTTTMKFYADLNVLQSNTVTQSSYNNGFNSATTIMNNKAYSSTTTALYVNPGAGDYRPRSLSSPMFASTPNATAVAARVHPWVDYGLDGGKRNPANKCAGAYSGVWLMTH